MAIMALTRHDTDVAMAAPFSPMPRGKTATQSSTMLSSAPVTLATMAYLGEPSRRMTNNPTVETIEHTSAGNTHSR